MNTSACGACAENVGLSLAHRDVARVLVCIEGAGQIEHGGAGYAVGKGDVFLLPTGLESATFSRTVL